MKRGFTGFEIVIVGSVILAVAGLLTAYANRSETFGAQPALTIPQGGTGTSTFSAGKIPVGTSNPLRLTEVSTTTASCTGSASCTSFTVIGSSPVSISATGGGGSGTVSTSTNETAGRLPYWTTTSGTPAKLGEVATNTLTANSPLSLSGAAVIIAGASRSLSLDTSGAWSGTAGSLAADGGNCSAGNFPLGVDASGAVQNCTDAWTEAENTAAAYLSTVDISANTNLAVTYPIQLSNDTLSFNNANFLGTSSALTQGHVLYSSGGRTVAGTATGTVSAGSGISVTAGQSVIGSGLTVTNTIGYPFPANATGTTIAFSQGLVSNGSTTVSGLTSGFVGNNNGLLYGAASSSFFGYTPLNPTRQLTVAGTANQITSSVGAQDLSADRTWTLSLPSHVIFPTSFQASLATITNATTSNLHITNLTNDALAVDGNGRVYATTTGLLTAGTGISLDSSVRRLIGGAAAITNTGVISASCSGGTTCSGTNPLTISSFNFPYTATTNFAATANSTTTPIWFRGYPISLQASSTAWFDQLQVGSTTATALATSTFFTDVAFRRTASTTNLIISGAPNGPLSTNQAGLVVASTTGAVTAGTGISLDSSVRQIFGGSLQITNSGVTSAVAGSGISLSGGTGAVTITANAPFTPNAASVFYGQISNSTTTQIHFGGYPTSLSASSTSYFDLINVGSTTASAQATSTFFNNVRIAGNASTSKFWADGLITCNSENMLTWANGVFGCESDTSGGAGGSFPFVPDTTYATNTSATSTGLWAKMGIYASTTNNYFQGLTIDNTSNSDAWTQYGKSAFEWSTGYNSTNNNFVIASGTNLTSNPALTIDKNLLTTLKGGAISQGSTTVVGDFTITGTTKLATSLSGLALLTSGTVSAYGGAAACSSNNFVTTISSTGGTTCGTASITINSNPVALGGSITVFPFTPGTSFGSVANATGTLMSLTAGLSASSTVRFGAATVSTQFTWDSSGGALGLGTTTPRWALQIASSSASQLALSDASAASSHWVFRTINSNFYLGTSSPTNYATSTFSALTISPNGQVSAGELDYHLKTATSTNMVIDWLTTPNQVLVRIGTSATTIGFNNASTTGMTKRILVCNPGSTASTITWAQTGSRILWPSGTAPTQTTTANKCDTYSFIITQATSTSVTDPKILGAQTASF